MVDRDRDALHPFRAPELGSPPKPGGKRTRALWWGATGLVAALAVARRWQQMGPFPSGLDGGQWLALGRGLTGVGRSTEGAYAPLVPLLTAAAAALAGPMTGLKVVAMLGLLATLLGAATLATLGLAGPWRVALVVGVASASAIGEPLAYGGYPQLIALGAMLAATALQARAVVEPRPQRRVALAAALAVAVLAHHVYGPLALLCALVVWSLRLATTSPGGRSLRGALNGLLPLLPATATTLVVLAAFHRAGYAPPLDAAGLGRLDAFLYATRESPWLWAMVVAGGVVALAARPAPSEPFWLATTSLVAVPAALFLLAPEPRLLPPVLVGSAAALLGAASRARATRSARAAVGVGTAVVVATLALAGDGAATRYVAFYRVASPSLLAATRAVPPAGAGIVAVRANQRGWPVGWWWEGLTTRTIAVGSDLRWLGFPQERERAALAARFFAAPLSPSELRQLAAATGVRVLVCNPREWIGWQRWLADPDPPVRVLYEDDETLAMQIVGGP